MRRVTAKPPNMLMVVSTMPTKAMPRIQSSGRPTLLILGMAVVALALAAINMFGGFAVTRRMLAMFRK